MGAYACLSALSFWPKLEESQRLAEQQRRKKAQEQRQNAEGVAQPLHTANENSPAFVPDQDGKPARKQLPS